MNIVIYFLDSFMLLSCHVGLLHHSIIWSPSYKIAGCWGNPQCIVGDEDLKHLAACLHYNRCLARTFESLWRIWWVEVWTGRATGKRPVGVPGKASAKTICNNPHMSFSALEVCTSSAILLRGFTISAGIGEFAMQASVGVWGEV